MKKSRKHDNTSHTRFLRVETLENRFLLSVSSPNLDEIQIDGNQLSYESLLNFAEIPAYIATQPSSDASPAIRHSEIAIVPDSVAVDDISTASETENVANSLNSIVAEEQQLPIVNITKVHDGIATPDGNILQNASFELERNDSHASDRSLDVTVWFRIIYSHNWTIQQPDGTTTIIPGLVSDLVLRWCTVTFQPGETKTQITLPVAQGYFTGNVTLQVSLGNSSENDYIVGQKNSADAKLQTSLISEEQQLPIVNITKVHDGIATPDGNILQNASFELERNDSHASDCSLDVAYAIRIIYSQNWTIQQLDGTTTIVPVLVSDLVGRGSTVTFQPGETKTQITLPVAQGYFTGNVTLQVSLGNSSENDYIVGQKNSADAKLQTSLISEEQDFIPKSTISRDFPEISETYPQAVNRASSVLNNIEIATAANARIVEIDTYFSQPKRVIYGNNIEYTVSDKRLSEIDWKKSSSLSAFDSVFSSWDHFISILESEQLQKEFF